MHEFWYDFVKPKYREKTRLCYMYTDSFIVYIKTEGVYSNIAKNVKTRFHTLSFEIDRPLFKEKIKK